MLTSLESLCCPKLVYIVSKLHYWFPWLGLHGWVIKGELESGALDFLLISNVIFSWHSLSVGVCLIILVLSYYLSHWAFYCKYISLAKTLKNTIFCKIQKSRDKYIFLTFLALWTITISSGLFLLQKCIIPEA